MGGCLQPIDSSHYAENQREQYRNPPLHRRLLVAADDMITNPFTKPAKQVKTPKNIGDNAEINIDSKNKTLIIKDCTVNIYN